MRTRFLSGFVFLLGASTGWAGTPSLAASPSAPRAPSRTAPLSVTVDVQPEFLTSTGFGAVVVTRCRLDQACTARLFLTPDGGDTWRDVTPPLDPGFIIDDVFFLDREHGWVAAWTCDTLDVILYRTSDGGRSWIGSPAGILDCHAGSRSIPVFTNAVDGWLMTMEPVGEGATLSRSTDGGATWTPARRLPTLGGIEFTDRSHGWLGGAGNGLGYGQLFETWDGGSSWHRRWPRRPVAYHWATAAHDLPTFFGAHGVIALTTVRRGEERVAIDGTRDGGRSWRAVSTVSLGSPSEPSPFVIDPPASFPSPSTWWVVGGANRSVFTTTNAGRRWTMAGTAPTSPMTIVAMNDDVAWLGCFQRDSDVLYRTTDGGHSWTRVTPPA